MKAPSAPLPATAAQMMHDALAAQQRGDPDRAERLYRELTRNHPGFPDAWHYWGLLAHLSGRKDEALGLLQRALDLDPDNLVFLLNVGRALREQGRFSDSIACLNRAHQLAPDHAQVLVLLTQSMLAVERGGELVAEIERHLQRARRNWHLHMLLGDCLEQRGDRHAALAAFAEAARLAPPDEPRPHLRRADAASKAQDSETALRCLEAALRIDGFSAEARAGLANLASESGQFARAERLAREALSFDPTLYYVWELLTNIASEESLPRLANELNEATRRAGEDPRVWALHFARGRVLEKLGDYDSAFAAYAAGNQVRGAMQPYSREAQINYSKAIITTLDASFTERSQRIGVAHPRVIFICGMPRSGTTLVESILASHPAVAAGGEQRFVYDWLRRELGMSQMSQTASWLRQLDDAELGELIEEWRSHLHEEAGEYPLVTDKMPANFMLLGLIHVCFPTAPIIHVRRDPRDNCFSCYSTAFAEGNWFSYALDAVGHYYRLHDALVAHWKRVLPPQRIIEVVYERLVGNPEAEIRRMIEAVGLEWDPRCVNFHETRRTVATASVYQVRQPLYSSSIGRWRHFERHLGPLIRELEGPAPL